ncbi:MAG: hypothetical protein R2860_09220 [Desulfobacterales bacterium]
MATRPSRVVVNNEGSSFYTIVASYDFKGLFTSVGCHQPSGLNIAVSKIATKVDQVVDVFLCPGRKRRKGNRTGGFGKN